MNNVRYTWDLIAILTQKEIKVRYKNNLLGYLWSVAHPLALTGVFYLAFKIFMRIQLENFVLFLVAGLFPWHWLSNSVTGSPMVFLNNASLIKKVQFPRLFVPFVQVMQEAVHFLLALPVVLLTVLLHDRVPTWHWLYGVPLLMIVQFLLAYGISLLLGSVNLFFRDLERLTGLVMMLAFYCTPIFYSETMIPEKYQFVLQANPFAPLTICWRTLFMEGQLPLLPFAFSLIYGLIFLAIGYLVYRKLSWRFAEVL